MNDEEPPTALTIDQLYAGVLEHLSELDGLRQRLLGQADAYHTLIAAGHGALRVVAPSPPPAPPTPPPPPTPISAPDVSGP